MHSISTEEEDAAKEIEAFQRETENLKAAEARCVQSIAEAWNAMASQYGLAQVAKFTDTRKTHLKKRIEEHGAEKLIKAIDSIPDYPFLLGRSDSGWKANFDWFIRPDRCAKLIEGGYERQEGGRASGWRQ